LRASAPWEQDHLGGRPIQLQELQSRAKAGGTSQAGYHYQRIARIGRVFRCHDHSAGSVSVSSTSNLEGPAAELDWQSGLKTFRQGVGGRSADQKEMVLFEFRFGHILVGFSGDRDIGPLPDNLFSQSLGHLTVG